MSAKSRSTQLSEEIEALIDVNDGNVPDWHHDAACKDFATELSERLFFPTSTRDPEKHLRRSICGACPVRRECENWGNLVSPRYGAYGGYLPRERRDRRRGVLD